jgi:hypothetical protein
VGASQYGLPVFSAVFSPALLASLSATTMPPGSLTAMNSMFDAEKHTWMVYRIFIAFIAALTESAVAYPSTKMGIPFASIVKVAPFVT